MEERRRPGRPPKNPDTSNGGNEMPELSDAELARHANALSRTFDTLGQTGR